MGKNKDRLNQKSIPWAEDILSQVMNLPAAGGEDLTDTVADQTTAVEELMKMVNRKIAMNNGEGQYVWKKSTKPITLHFTQTSGGWATPITLQVTSSEIDVNTLTSEDFVGVKGTCGSYTYEFTSATEFIGLTYESPVEYSYSNGIITIQGIISNVVTWSDYTKEGQFIDFVVSSDAEAYPNGGEQDGYWYELVEDGIAGFDMGEITITGSSTTSLTIPHNLKVKPSLAVLIPSNGDVQQSSKTTFALWGYSGFGKTAGSSNFGLSSNGVASVDENNFYITNAPYAMYATTYRWAVWA